MTFVYYIIGIIFGLLIALLVGYFKAKESRSNPDATIEFNIYNENEPIKLVLHRDVGYLMSRKEIQTNVVTKNVSGNIYNSYNDKTDI